MRFVWHVSISGDSIGLYRFLHKPSQLNKIMLKQVEENANANNEEWKRAIEMLNTGMSATVASRHFGCTRKTIERLYRRFRVEWNVADHLPFIQLHGPNVTFMHDNARPHTTAINRQFWRQIMSMYLAGLRIVPTLIPLNTFETLGRMLPCYISDILM